MKQLCIQVHHSPVDAERHLVIRQLSQIISDSNAENKSLPEIQCGADYTNFLVPALVWSRIRPKLKSLRFKMIITCEGEHGWSDYKLLNHFDSKIKLDELND